MTCRTHHLVATVVVEDSASHQRSAPHPTAYASAFVPPAGLTSPSLMLQSSINHPHLRSSGVALGMIAIYPFSHRFPSVLPAAIPLTPSEGHRYQLSSIRATTCYHIRAQPSLIPVCSSTGARRYPCTNTHPPEYLSHPIRIPSPATSHTPLALADVLVPAVHAAFSPE